MGKNYIPDKDSEFDDFFKNLRQCVIDYTADGTWTHIPADAVTGFSASYVRWHTAYEKTLGPHTSADTAEKNRIRKVEEKYLEDFVNQYLRNPPVTDFQRDEIGVPNKNTHHTTVPAPLTSPELTPDTGTRRRVIVHYRDEGSEKRGKPDHVHGLELRWAVLDHPPAHNKELVNSAFDTRSPLTLEFDEADRGKRVYMMGLWEIEREGIKGPPGAIVEAVIP